MKRFHKLVAAAAITAVGLLASTAASADTPPVSNLDQNAQSDAFFSAGSDTTYSLHQRLSTIYNASEGCTVQGSAQGSAAVNGIGSLSCKSPDPLATTPGLVQTENYDHDVSVDLYPTGSGNGLNTLCNNVSLANTGPIQIARSSRTRNANECPGFTFYGYAKDAVVPVIFSSLNPGLAGLTQLSQVQIQNIFRASTQSASPACAGLTACITWNDVQAGLPDTPIKVYGVQTGSGTYATFNNYDGVDTVNFPNGSDSRAVAQAGCASAAACPARVLFENDASAIPVADRPDAIWFMSIGAWRSLVRQQAGSTPVTRLGNAAGATISMNTVTVRNGTFPTARSLWMATTNTRTTASQNAAQDFVNWVCTNSTGHSSLLGVNYGNAIDQAIGAIEGFVVDLDNSGAQGTIGATGGRCVIG